jgi:C-terminal peptidase prc
MKTRKCAHGMVVLLTAACVYADTPAPKQANPATPTATLARQAWAITDLVLEQDIDPPARQQMLLLGLKALLRSASKPVPSNLPARLSAVTTAEQFAAVLSEFWPGDEARPLAEDETHEQLLFQGLMDWRPRKEFESDYLSPKALKIHEVLVGNRYVGTGIQIRMDDKEKLAQIMVPFPGGPARKAGARPGDLIVAVDDVSMEGKPLREVVKRLQGEEGTKVSITVRQAGESKTRHLPMVRGVIPFTSVHGFRRTGEESWSFKPDPKADIAYLSLDDIKSSTPLEMRQIEPLVKAEAAKALVLDLRFTRGQDMHHAALVADTLLDGGTLWRVRDVQGRVKEYKADRDCLFRDMPLAVLVNNQTGRLGAILATALQERGRAVVVGETPLADLTVTSLVRLPEGQGALLLRTGTVERTARKTKAKNELERNILEDNRLVPDHIQAMENKNALAMMEWRNQQQSPEPKAGAKPPADPQLEKALALLCETLAQRHKKTQE